VLLSVDLSHETRIILFDFSLFIGGIQLYTTIAFTMGLSLALIIRILFQFFANNTQQDIYWTKLFDVLIGHKSHKDLDLDKSQKLIQKFYIKYRYLYKITTVFI